MIISHRHGFVFLKTRKTAGTSIEIALSDLCGDEDVITPVADVDEAYRFEQGIRGHQNCCKPGGSYKNSQDRSSLRFYNHMPARKIQPLLEESAWSSYFKFCVVRNPYDKAVSRYFWHRKIHGGSADLNQYIAKVAPVYLSDWSLYTLDGKIAVDRVFRFENLAEDLAAVCSEIGLPKLQLPRAKSSSRSDRRHYRELLSSRARVRIEMVCEKELQTFGYSF